MKIRIGSRGSRLARIQSATVGGLLKEKFPELETEFVFVTTSGDKNDSPVSQSGGKGVFVREIEDALLDGSVDIAVHSLKDLPSVLPDGLKIGAFLQREDPSDCLVLPRDLNGRAGFESLKNGAKIGTGSMRRTCQILEMRTDVCVAPVRGNIETRIAKMDSGEFDALVLATAALNRLEIKNRISDRFNPKLFVPAPGQGTLAVERRDGDTEVARITEAIECASSRICAEVERSFLHKLGGDCLIPAGCYAETNGDRIQAVAVMASADGSKIHRGQIEANAQNAAETGAQIAEKVMA